MHLYYLIRDLLFSYVCTYLSNILYVLSLNTLFYPCFFTSEWFLSGGSSLSLWSSFFSGVSYLDRFYNFKNGRLLEYLCCVLDFSVLIFYCYAKIVTLIISNVLRMEWMCASISYTIKVSDLIRSLSLVYRVSLIYFNII